MSTRKASKEKGCNRSQAGGEQPCRASGACVRDRWGRARLTGRGRRGRREYKSHSRSRRMCEREEDLASSSLPSEKFDKNLGAHERRYGHQLEAPRAHRRPSRCREITPFQVRGHPGQAGQCLPISLPLPQHEVLVASLCRVLSALPLPHISDLAPSHPLLTGPERSRSPNLSVLEALARKALADDGTEPAE